MDELPKLDGEKYTIYEFFEILRVHQQKFDLNRPMVTRLKNLCSVYFKVHHRFSHSIEEQKRQAAEFGMKTNKAELLKSINRSYFISIPSSGSNIADKLRKAIETLLK